jgi:VWFA-related protein
MRRTSIKLALTLTAILAFPTMHAPAQTTVESNLPGAGFDTPDSTAPTIQVYSRETILDVLVTDDKSRPVRNLKRSDFTILEDGHPQPIRSFSEYTRNTAAAPSPALPPNTYSNAHALPATGPVQIFYFDILNSSSADIVRSKQYIASYLRAMPPGTQVAIFSLSRNKDFRLLQSFTTDGQLAASVVDNLDAEWIRLPHFVDPIAAMNLLANYVAGIHGRKNLIWITPGMPLMITRDGGLSWAMGGGPDLTLVHQLMDLYDLFTREQIAIYPLDPRGVHGLGFGALRAEEVAQGTGGTTDNTNDYKGEIAKVVDQTSNFYTLSYIPPRANDDGHYHPITIHVDRPGLHLVYRNGYNDEHPAPPDAALKVHMDQATMGLGALPATQLLFKLKVQPSIPSPAQAGLSSAVTRRTLPTAKSGSPYDLIFKLDPTQLAFVQTADNLRSTSLEFDIAAYDFYGKLAIIRSQTFNLTLTPEEYAEFVQTPFQFDLPVDLPSGKLTLRAGIFDSSSRKIGTLEIPLNIAKESSAAQAANPATSIQ